MPTPKGPRMTVGCKRKYYRTPKEAKRHAIPPQKKIFRYDNNILLRNHDDYHRLPARIDPERSMDRKALLRNRHSRTRQQKRRHDEHAPRPRQKSRNASIRHRLHQGIRRRDDNVPHEIRRKHLTGLAHKPQDHRHRRRRSRTHIPRVRQLQGRKGRGHARRSRNRYKPRNHTALLRNMVHRLHGLALRLARLDDRRLLLPDSRRNILRQRIQAFRRYIGIFYRLFDRCGTVAAVDSPQEHRTTEKRHRIENIPLETQTYDGERQGNSATTL